MKLKNPSTVKRKFKAWMTIALLIFLLSSLNVYHAFSSVDDENERWGRIYGGPTPMREEAKSLVQTSDGGYALVGFVEAVPFEPWDVWLVKTDVAGNMEWNMTYGGTDSLEHGWDLVQTSDGGYAIAGDIDLGPVYPDAWLIKTDASGNMEWNMTYGGTGWEGAYSVVQTGDGGYAFAGGTKSFGAGESDFWLVKTDASGNHLWNMTYGGEGLDSAWSLVQTDDGGYALAGHMEASVGADKDFWLVKTDAAGNVEWNMTYGGISNDGAHSVIQTEDGGYAIAGYSNSFGDGSENDFWLVKTDASGSELWNMTYGGTGADYAYAVVETSDGGYAIAGYTGSLSDSRDAWLVKTDASGSELWNMTYGGTSNDEVRDLIQTNDTGYALAGHHFSVAVGYDFWLGKVDESGLIPEGFTIEVVLLLSTAVTVVSFSFFFKRKKREKAIWEIENIPKTNQATSR